MHNGFEDLDLDRLRRRRSEKWRLHPPDVLPAFIAELDYDLAEPLLAALREAVGLSDCGYAALDGIGETFAAFAQARHDWAVDPGMVHLVPDVMAGSLMASGDVESRQRLIEKFPTAALAVIDFPLDDWSKIHPKSGRLDRFVLPKALDTETA